MSFSGSYVQHFSISIFIYGLIFVVFVWWCRFELGLEKPDPRRALQSAFTIALAYVLGGLVPLIPYMFISNTTEAVIASVALTLVALLVFGYAKGYFTGNKPFKSAMQTTLVGAIASAAAFGMAKAIQRWTKPSHCIVMLAK